MLRQGQICHTEIPAPDVDRARAFYAGVFGWHFEEMSPGYLLFSDGVTGGAIDGGMTPSEDGVRLYFQVEDIDEGLARIRDNGGEAVGEKTEIGGGFIVPAVRTHLTARKTEIGGGFIVPAVRAHLIRAK